MTAIEEWFAEDRAARAKREKEIEIARMRKAVDDANAAVGVTRFALKDKEKPEDKNAWIIAPEVVVPEPYVSLPRPVKAEDYKRSSFYENFWTVGKQGDGKIPEISLNMVVIVGAVVALVWFLVGRKK